MLTSDLPDEEELRRWLGENISMLIIPHSCFISNKNFFPVLSKKHQESKFVTVGAIASANFRSLQPC